MEDYSLTILGSSSATPNSLRFPSAQVLHFRGKYYLLDCGEGTQIQLRRAKIPFERIAAIFISHLHGDHYFGIFGLLASLSLTGRKTALTIYCPKELEQIIQYQFSAVAQPLLFPLKFVHFSKTAFDCVEDTPAYSIYSIALSHRIDCWGVCFREKERERNILKSAIETYHLGIEEIKNIKQGADYIAADGTIVPNSDLTAEPPAPFSYAYISDTLFNPEVAKYVQNVQLMYHEATFADNNAALAEKTCHSTARQAAECAKRANAGKLIIGHFSARYKNLDSHLQEATEVFENTELAYDLHTYTTYKKPKRLWPETRENQ